MGTITPNIGIYVPAVGETDYFQDFSDGMTHIDNHAHTGAPLGGAAVLTTVDGTALSSAVPAVNPLWPGRCKFSAYVAATIPNVTGDGTVYTIIYGSTINNVGGVFNVGNGRFTAPVTGNYLLSATVSVSGIGAGHTASVCLIVTTTASYLFGAVNPVPIVVGGQTVFNNSVIAFMNAGDNAAVAIQTSNSTKTVSVYGLALPTAVTTFQGYLLG
jgi:hypothetical protein